ncbi:MAG TPA: polysaccharide biosynthesis/export family protein, partial [Pyrinomonadaceae bacterium]
MTAVFKAEDRKRRAIWPMFGLVSVLLLATTASAQTPVANNSITAPAKAGAATRASEHYRIGPGDVLDVRVFNKPQFSRDGVRVDGRGMIRMPFIDGEIQAACMTEQQLAD